MAKFTYQQAINGGLSTQRKARSIPFDPKEMRVYPLLPNTWEASCIWVDRVFHTWSQYDIITTGNQRQKRFLLDGVELPISSLSKFFEGLRVEKAASLMRI